MALRQFSLAIPGTLKHAVKQQQRLLASTVVGVQDAPNLVSDRIPHKGDYSLEKCEFRREWVEQYTGVDMPDVSTWWNEEHSPEILRGNIEVPIGTTTLPIGVAGPLQIRGDQAQGEFLAPLATTESGLVSAVSKGAKALSNSGGVRTNSAQQRMTRCPALQTGSPEEAVALGDWAKTQREVIQKEVISKFSRVAQLKEIMTAYDLETAHVMMYYETGDAAGQNVTSTVSWEAARWMAKNAPIGITVNRFWVEGNISGDKKCSHINALFGRGLAVGATAIIPESILQEDLNTSGEAITDYYHVMSRIGERSHMMGVNLTVGSLIGSIFPSIGQDCGSILDSSMSRTQFDRNRGPEGGVAASLVIPSLVIGTVGGGTNLPTQKECLELMGCHGAGKVRKLGEIIAGFALALDLASIAELSQFEPINKN